MTSRRKLLIRPTIWTGRSLPFTNFDHYAFGLWDEYKGTVFAVTGGVYKEVGFETDHRLALHTRPKQRLRPRPEF